MRFHPILNTDLTTTAVSIYTQQAYEINKKNMRWVWLCVTEWKRDNGGWGVGTWWKGLWGGWRAQMGWNCSVSKCLKVGKVGIWITLRCCSHIQGKINTDNECGNKSNVRATQGMMTNQIYFFNLHQSRWNVGLLPDWLGKCAKLAKLVALEVCVGGAAKMSPPRSESKSNFFSWAALWAWERANPGDWATVKTK